MNKNVSCSSDAEIVERALLQLLRPSNDLHVGHIESSFKKKFRLKKILASPEARRAEWIPPPARIFIHEVLTPHTISVCWSDSQTGHYGDQIWRLGFARTSGFCALSGQPIRAGDDVFRPRRNVVKVPSNWNRMILASVVPTMRDLALT
ncbi:DUF3331 domain-containing protein [Paraburkholderia bengalensis]|uniref:DUF3331 domain-containing protein n=1 Tax=Paraburkholderia bengalensis TaxID=2747562 RepID=A0ABU8J3R0_9BURK